MARLPRPVEDLLEELRRLPGIGPRGAERIAVHLMAAPAGQSHALADALRRAADQVQLCAVCGNWCEGRMCTVCRDPARANGKLCVVERVVDLWAFEHAEAFDGRYHILGGTLSPLAGVTPDDLRIAELEARMADEAIAEVILATNPNVDGDATAHYLAQRLAPSGCRVTRIALGLPLGGHLDYADAGTLRLALEGRRGMAS